MFETIYGTLYVNRCICPQRACVAVVPLLGGELHARIFPLIVTAYTRLRAEQQPYRARQRFIFPPPVRMCSFKPSHFKHKRTT